MRLYIAGPMTGHPLFNFPAFDEARDVLRSAGFEVVSPADIDRALGFDPVADHAQPFTRDQYAAAMRRDLDFVFEVDGVATLPGWARSRGARAEVALCEALGKPHAPVPMFAAEAEGWVSR